MVRSGKRKLEELARNRAPTSTITAGHNLSKRDADKLEASFRVLKKHLEVELKWLLSTHAAKLREAEAVQKRMEKVRDLLEELDV